MLCSYIPLLVVCYFHPEAYNIIFIIKVPGFPQDTSGVHFLSSVKPAIRKALILYSLKTVFTLDN